jgi:protein-S-isoprenylcysteine O-methyltransferase Ste14
MNLSAIMIVLSVLWIGSEFILSVTKRSSSTDLRSDAFSLRILLITIAVAVNAGILVSFLRIGYFGNGTPMYSIAGLVLIVCGVVVRWVAVFSLKHRFTVDVSIRNNHRIMKEGLYRFVRHPAYAGSLLSFLGLGLYFADYISVLVIFLPVCSALIYRIHVEEKALIDYFGKEYETYCASTKRLIPGVF